MKLLRKLQMEKLLAGLMEKLNLAQEHLDIEAYWQILEIKALKITLIRI